MISYQDLEKLHVPEDTRKFIDDLLCAIHFFVEEKRGNADFSEYSTYAILYTMYYSEKWINVLGNLVKDFSSLKTTNNDDYPVEISNHRKIELFAKYSYLFDSCRMENYRYLHPLDILLSSLKDIVYDYHLVNKIYKIPYNSVADMKFFVVNHLYPNTINQMNDELFEHLKGTIDESLFVYLQIASKLNRNWNKKGNWYSDSLPLLYAIFIRSKTISIEEEYIRNLLLASGLTYKKMANPVDFHLELYKDNVDADYFYINSLLEGEYSSCKSITDLFVTMITKDEKIKEYLRMISTSSYNKFRKCLLDKDYAKSMLYVMKWNDIKDINIEHSLESIMSIHLRLQALMKDSNILTALLKKEKDIEKLSFFLGLYLDHDAKQEEEYQQRLEKYGFSRLEILNTLGITFDFPIDEEKFPQLFVENYLKYLIDPVDKENLKMDFHLMDIFFGSTLNDSKVLEKLAQKMNVDLKKLKIELETGRDYEESLTQEERLVLLSNQQIETLDSTKLDSILSFGSTLFHSANYIHTEMPKLIASDTNEKSIATINQTLQNIYQQDNKKPSFFTKWFLRKKENKVDIKRVDSSLLAQLKESIEENIQILSQELLGYNYLQDYIAVYYQKNLSYLKIASMELEKIEKEVSLTTSDEDYAHLLQMRTRVQLLSDKKNHFEVSNQLMKQQLLKVNQMMMNHSITLNALEMARDDLIPLMGIELSISKGLSTENDSRELTNGIMDLFQTLLNQNQEGIKENIKRLKKSGVSDEIYALIDKDAQSFLQKLTENSNNEIEDAKIKQLTNNTK